jgi:hypothetical protein
MYMLKKVVPMFAALVLCGCASTGGSHEVVIDASTPEVMGASLERMYGALPEDDRARLALSIYLIGLEKLKSEGKLDAEGRPTVKLSDYDLANRLNGKTYDQIVSMAGGGLTGF